MFEQWIAPSLNASLVGCLDDLGIIIDQLQFCVYENSIKQVLSRKQRVPNSTPYPPRLIDSHSSWFRLYVGRTNRVGGGVLENGGEL